MAAGRAASILAAAAYASFSFPAYHFVVLTHLHNLVPLIFLWDWAGRIAAPRARLAFRLTQLLWIVRAADDHPGRRASTAGSQPPPASRPGSSATAAG